MLKHEEGSLRFQDPFDLLHASCRVTHRAKYERHHHTVKCLIGKRQGQDRSLGERYGHLRLLHTWTRIGEHGCIWFNRFHPLDPFWIVAGKVQSATRSHLQDNSIRLSRCLLAQRIGETTFGTKLGIPLVERCKARMKDLRRRFPFCWCPIMLLCHVLCSLYVKIFPKNNHAFLTHVSALVRLEGSRCFPPLLALVVVFRPRVASEPPRLPVLLRPCFSALNQARSQAGKPRPNRYRICSAITSGPGSSYSNHQVMAWIIMLIIRRASSTGS